MNLVGNGAVIDLAIDGGGFLILATREGGWEVWETAIG